jgi:hypothetical protein
MALRAILILHLEPLLQRKEQVGDDLTEKAFFARL